MESDDRQNTAGTIGQQTVRFQVGSRVGQFIVLRLISIEGLCQNYLVKHSVTDKEAVLKLLPKELNQDSDFLKRFDSVAEKIQHLIHPGILIERRLEARGEDHYVVEDFIHNKTGEPDTLEDQLSSGRSFTENEVKSFSIQVCNALESAYKYKDLNYVHKDFKPAHILTDPDGQFRIAHFSLVPLVGEQNFLKYLESSISQITKDDLNAIHDDLDKDLKDDLVSMSGVTNLDNTSSMLLLSEDDNEIIDVGNAKLVGSEYLKKIVAAKPEDNSEIMLKVKNTISAFDSIEHMSPEQKSTGKVTTQSNIYSLGFILYRMLTGKKMSGSWGLPSSFGCHKDWDPIILKCLKRDVNYRYQSVHDVLNDIEQIGERKHYFKIASYTIGILAIPIIAISTYNCVSDPVKFNFKKFEKTARIERIQEDIALRHKTSSTEIPHHIDDDALISSYIKISPAGGYFIIRKGKELIREIGTFPETGIKYTLRKGSYTIYAGLNGYLDLSKTYNLTKINNDITIKLQPDLAVAKHTEEQFVTATPEFGKNWLIENPQIEFIPIKPGQFTMGSPMIGLLDAPNESPVHRVKLTQQFWMSKLEIKQKVYKQITNSTPSFHNQVGNDAPVENVTWSDAVKFCIRLTKHQSDRNTLPDGYEYRLPTEAEWEYCCRAGTKSEFSFKNPLEVYKNVWFEVNSNNKVHIAGTKEPNSWGLHDMHGNVWEWCLDAGYDYTSQSEVNPITKNGTKRLVRGGSFNAPRSLIRSTSRNAIVESYKSSSLGFRVVLAPIIDLNQE